MIDAEAKLRQALGTEEIVAGIHGDVSWAVRELLEANERLRADRDYRKGSADRAHADRVDLEARIEAALAIPKDLRKEMGYAMWPGLTPDDLLDEIEKRMVKALKGGGDAE